MKKYFSEYIEYLRAMLEGGDTDYAKLREEMLVKISFMQHERFIHLIVTCLFAVLLFMSIIIFFVTQLLAFLAVTALMLALLIPYIAHYFFLENGVQKLYSIYDTVCSRADIQNMND